MNAHTVALNYIKLGAAANIFMSNCNSPVCPNIIHSTPEHFGADKSQAIISVQMASAYCGTCLMPPLLGLIAKTRKEKV